MKSLVRSALLLAVCAPALVSRASAQSVWTRGPLFRTDSAIAVPLLSVIPERVQAQPLFRGQLDSLRLTEKSTVRCPMPALAIRPGTSRTPVMDMRGRSGATSAMPVIRDGCTNPLRVVPDSVK